MHYIQEEIGIPKIKIEKISNFHAIFTVSPLPPGYGMTVGNAFRRVLLSSLPGASVTGIKIDGVSHEYSTVKGVKESVLDISLNLKGLFIKKSSKEPSTCSLQVSKEGPVYTKDIKCPSEVEILRLREMVEGSELVFLRLRSLMLRVMSRTLSFTPLTVEYS
jgi:DNA-directed RNA polymerase subunit alpha